jgi:uncharacterized protein YqgQ
MSRREEGQFEYALLLLKLQDLTENDHISEKEYLDFSIILKEHREKNQDKTQLLTYAYNSDTYIPRSNRSHYVPRGGWP